MEERSPAAREPTVDEVVAQQWALRRVWGRALLICEGGGYKAAAAAAAIAAVDAFTTAWVLDSIQQSSHKSGWLLASLEGGFHTLCDGLSLGQVH